MRTQCEDCGSLLKEMLCPVCDSSDHPDRPMTTPRAKAEDGEYIQLPELPLDIYQVFDNGSGHALICECPNETIAKTILHLLNVALSRPAAPPVPRDEMVQAAIADLALIVEAGSGFSTYIGPTRVKKFGALVEWAQASPPAVPPQGYELSAAGAIAFEVMKNRMWTPSEMGKAFLDAGYRKSTPPAASQVEALREENARLRKGLDDYGRHDRCCVRYQSLTSAPCTCGLDAALRGRP